MCRILRKLMHGASSNAQIIWYDALTIEGKLQWQDNLTALNEDFFEACDGLFVNYTWRAKTPSQAVAAAGEGWGIASCSEPTYSESFQQL